MSTTHPSSVGKLSERLRTFIANCVNREGDTMPVSAVTVCCSEYMRMAEALEAVAAKGCVSDRREKPEAEGEDLQQERGAVLTADAQQQPKEDQPQLHPGLSDEEIERIVDSTETDLRIVHGNARFDPTTFAHECLRYARDHGYLSPRSQEVEPKQ